MLSCPADTIEAHAVDAQPSADTSGVSMNGAPGGSGPGGRGSPEGDSGERARRDRDLYAWLGRLRQRRARGERLTERELMCLQIVDNGYGCSACAGRGPL